MNDKANPLEVANRCFGCENCWSLEELRKHYRELLQERAMAEALSSVRERYIFGEYLKLERLNAQRSPWVKSKTLYDWLLLLEGEIEEAKHTLLTDPTNHESFRNEMADVLANVLRTIAKAELRGMLSMADVIEHAHQKVKRRKPWLLDTDRMQPQTPEEEHAWVVREKTKEQK